MLNTNRALNLGAMARRQVAVAIATLADLLDGPDPRLKLQAALALLRYAEVPPPGPYAGRAAGLLGLLSDAELEQAIAVLRRRLEPDGPAAPDPANRTATPGPVERHPTGAPWYPPASAGAEAATDSRAPDAAAKNTPLAEPALTPCPAAAASTAAPPSSPNPGATPMSRADRPSPLAAPPGTESPRGDADPMSRRVLPSSHSADSAFRRRLPQPPNMEPPWPFQPPGAEPYRRQRWPPWR